MAHFICLDCNFLCPIFGMHDRDCFPYRTTSMITRMQWIVQRSLFDFILFLFPIHFHSIFYGKIMCSGRVNSRELLDHQLQVCAKPIEQKQPVLHYNTSLPIEMQRDDHHKDQHFKRMSYFLFRTGWIRMLCYNKYSNNNKIKTKRKQKQKRTQNSIRSGSIS